MKLAETDPAAAKLVERYEHRVAEELYDLAADPFEMKNLAADPAQAQTLARLRSKVTEWRAQQGEDLGKVLMPADARAGKFPYAK